MVFPFLFSRLTRVLLFVVGVVLLFIVLFALSPSVRMQTVRATLTTIGADLPTDEHGFTNILLLGVGDVHHDGADLTDTMMIASIDPATRSTVLLSLPRDLFLDANKRLTNGRINAVYANEKYRLEIREGLEEQAASLQALHAVTDEIGEKVGMQMHGAIKADFTAFTELVDALGGVDVEVPKTIVDYSYPIGENQPGLFRIEAGMHHLDGETALRYARSRHSTSDFDRSARQQQLLKAIGARAGELGMIGQAQFLLDLHDRLQEHVETTMTTGQLLGLAEIGSQLSLDRMITMQINFASGGDGIDAAAGGFVYPAPAEAFSGASILLPTALPGKNSDWTQIRTFVQLLMTQRDLYLRDPVIRIEDLSRRYLPAYRLRNEFLRYGFDVLPVVSVAEDVIPLESFVYFTDNDDEEAAAFAGNLLSIPVVQQNTLSGSGDIVIRLGSTYRYRPFATMSGAVLSN